MMKYALVHGTRICEFRTTADECFPVAAGLQWVEVGDDTTELDAYVDGEVAKAPSPPPVDLVGYAANARWLKETGGITLPNGLQVATDSVAQTKIAAAKTAFDNGTLSGTIEFKALNTWAEVDAAAITAVYAAVVTHIQNCYATEKQVVDAIAAETITTIAQIDAAFAAM